MMIVWNSSRSKGPPIRTCAPSSIQRNGSPVVASLTSQQLPTILAQFDPIIGGNAEIRDAVVLDVVDLLHQRCRQTRQRELIWVRNRRVDVVRTVIVSLSAAGHLVWDLDAGELAQHPQLPDWLDTQRLDCLHLTRLFDQEAVEGTAEVQ